MANKVGAKKSTARRAAAGTPTATINMTIQGKGLTPDPDQPGKLPRPELKEELQKLIVKLQKSKKGFLGDQRRRLVSSMGCVSNPGGPGC